MEGELLFTREGKPGDHPLPPKIHWYLADKWPFHLNFRESKIGQFLVKELTHVLKSA